MGPKKSKICTKCGIKKYRRDFGKRKAAKDGLRPQCKECDKKYRIAYWKAHPNRLKSKDYKSNRESRWRKWGLTFTLEDYNTMFEAQGGKCAICGIHQNTLSKRLCVDHCHESLEVRGLLCTKCNTAIARFENDIIWLDKAMDYLGRGNE